ncbi:hypothetical protein GC176_24435 [bacterium]|nr:hypothetical protein [bacterium]
MNVTNLLRQLVDAPRKVLDPVVVMFRMLTIVFGTVSITMLWTCLQLMTDVTLQLLRLLPDCFRRIRKSSGVQMFGCLAQSRECHVDVLSAFTMRDLTACVKTFAFASFHVPQQFFQFGLNRFRLVISADSAQLFNFASPSLNLASETALVDLTVDLAFNLRCFVYVTTLSQIRDLAAHRFNASLKRLVLGSGTLITFAFACFEQPGLSFPKFVFTSFPLLSNFPITLPFRFDTFFAARLAPDFVLLPFHFLLRLDGQKHSADGNSQSGHSQNSTT